MYNCKECSKNFSRLCDLSKHTNIFHNGAEIYYNKWLKTDKDKGICKICGGKAKFRNLAHGYNYVCDKKECLHQFKYENMERGMLKKYGVHASSLNKELRNKQKETSEKRYGASSPLGSPKIQNKIKKTNLEKYGVENPLGSSEIRKKVEETNLKKYGYINAARNEKVKQKIKSTMLKNHGVESYLEKRDEIKKGMIKKYGVDHPAKDYILHNKQQKSAFKSKKFNNTNIHYRGSFELDFLEKYLEKYPDIINGPSIKYRYKSKNRVYHSDFFIPSKNLIVEIKNSYLYKRDKNMIKAKEKAAISSGFKYIIIIDKNYSYL
jgi:hypothetical protein